MLANVKSPWKIDVPKPHSRPRHQKLYTLITSATKSPTQTLLVSSLQGVHICLCSAPELRKSTQEQRRQADKYHKPNTYTKKLQLINRQKEYKIGLKMWAGERCSGPLPHTVLQWHADECKIISQPQIQLSKSGLQGPKRQTP